jgi:hypothetical protein
MRYPIDPAALGVIIEQLFSEPTAVVIAGTEEKNSLHGFIPSESTSSGPQRQKAIMRRIMGTSNNSGSFVEFAGATLRRPFLLLIWRGCAFVSWVRCPVEGSLDALLLQAAASRSSVTSRRML